VVTLLALFYFAPSFIELSFTQRIELLESSWEMFSSAPLTGVGLGLFTDRLLEVGPPSGPTLFLEPVHNIFLLVGAECGILSFAFLLALFVKGFWISLKRGMLLFAVSLGQLFLLGSFDHYLYTLPQGLFLLSLTVGLIFSYDSS
jgi:O-antigen ligase